MKDFSEIYKNEIESVLWIIEKQKTGLIFQTHLLMNIRKRK